MPIVDKDSSFRRSSASFAQSTPLSGRSYARRATPKAPSPGKVADGFSAAHDILGPSGTIDAVADILLGHSALTSPSWASVLSTLRRQLETESSHGHALSWLFTPHGEDFWSPMRTPLNEILEAAWKEFDPVPEIFYGEVSLVDYSSVAIASGGGFKSEGIDFEPLEDED